MRRADTITSFSMLLAVIRAGYTAFPISTRNSVPAIVHLLTKTNLDHLIVGPEESYQRHVREVFAAMEKQGLRVPFISTTPLFGDIYRDETGFALLPDTKDDMFDVALYLHSSGL